MKKSWFIMTLLAVLLALGACDNRAEQDTSLTEELEALQAQVGDFETQVSEQTEELQNARARVSELEAQLAEQEEQLAQVEQLTAQRNQLQAQVRQLQPRVNELQGQLEARTTALQAARARIQDLQQRRELTLESQIEEIDRLMQQLRAQRSALAQRLGASGTAPTEGQAAPEAAEGGTVIGPAEEAPNAPQNAPQQEQEEGGE